MTSPLTLTFNKENGKFAISEVPVKVQHGQKITFVNSCDCRVTISGPENPFNNGQSWPGDLSPGDKVIRQIETLDATESSSDVAVQLTFHFTAVFHHKEGMAQDNGNSTTLKDDIIIE